MQISIKCSLAVHCLIFIHEAKGIARVTRSLLAESTGSNPVVIRSVLSALKKAGLITVPRGTGGAELRADPSQITLYQIYIALEPNGVPTLIGIHPCEGRPCPVSFKTGTGCVLFDFFHRTARTPAPILSRQELSISSSLRQPSE